MTSQGTSLSERIKLPIVALAMVLLASVILVAILRDAIVDRPQYSVSDTGIGRIAYTPDIAIVTFGVQVSRAASAEAALQELNHIGTQIEERLTAFNIPREDSTVQNYTIQPYYAWSEAQGSYIDGYDANQQYAVTLRDIAEGDTRIRNLVEAVTAGGSNQVVSIRFTTDHMDTLREQAKQVALQEARNNAVHTATALGVRLGDITSWWVNPIQPSYQELYYGDKSGYGGTSEATAAGFIPSGEQEVVVEATVTFRVR